MKRSWTFNVNCQTYPGEIVCVTGSCPELGNWKTDQVLPLTSKEDPYQVLYPRYGGEIENSWTVTVDLPQGIDISYRYCICSLVEIHETKKFVVRRWETNLRPRKIACHEINDDLVESEFGYCNGSNADQVIQRGWLTNETVVQLKLFGDKSLNIWKKKYRNREFFVKVTPVRANKSNMDDPTVPSYNDDSQSMDMISTRGKFQSWPIVEVAKLTDEDCLLRPQSQFGILYEENGYILFQAQVMELPTVAFLIDVFCRSATFQSENHEPAELIGSCYIMPKHFTTTSGHIKEAIISSSKFEAIGDINVNFLVVNHINEDPCDFAVTFAKHWQPHWKGLDVGHRGLGNSFTKLDHCSHLRENTIASLKNAHAHGADMVEFDVQLSKDKIPVIYHDFELCTTSVGKNGEHKELIPTQLKNLTLAQLRGLKIHHHFEYSNGVKEFNEENDEHEPFPTLEEALNKIDESCGFNIELKWDMMLKDGSNECHFPFEINLFLDTVLKTVLTHAGKRKIVFSSFNPDLCSMIRLKQNRYPALLLTQGINSKYDDYYDPRTWTIKNGSNFVAMSEILGVAAMADDIQRDPSQVQLVKERGQVIFVWTDDQNDPATFKYLKELGINGLIYDRIDVNSNKDQKKQQTIFPCLEENEVEKMARAHKSSCCSCSPPTSPSTSDENSEKNDENEVEEQAAKIQPEPETAIMSSKEYKQQPDLNTFTGVLMASKS